MKNNAAAASKPGALIVVMRLVEWCIPYARNPRKNDAAVDQMASAIREFGFTIPILARSTGDVIDGHLRLKAAQKLGLAEIPVILCDDWSEPQVKAFRLLVNRSANWAEWDTELVALELADLQEFKFNLALTGFDPAELSSFMGADNRSDRGGSLADRFLVPPFSVLDARQGYWQDRKQAWLALGIQSEIGRGETMGSLASARRAQLAAPHGGQDVETWVTSSIFDPVLCELTYRWFCPAGGQVVDPFAGGSVRGIVAGLPGYRYWGCDLRAEQIAANEEQRQKIAPDAAIEWVCGDALRMLPAAPPADLVFSCPPYGDLERYSDNPADLSTMDYPAFIETYRAIIRLSVAPLKPNRFACFVVGDFRDRLGYYRGFVADTIRAFADCGLGLYNDAVLVTAAGSLPIRVGKQFGNYRKLGKTHQNVLLFFNGDPKRIPEEFPEIEIPDDLFAQGGVNDE